MTAWWISLAVVVGLGLLLIWRLRRAAKVLDRILSEERKHPEPEAPRVEHRNR